jgi:hypothetical protein
MARKDDTDTDLPWRTTLRLTKEMGELVEAEAALDRIPAATLCRMLVREALQRRVNERERPA